MNVALYGAGGKRWAMTERGSGTLRRDANHLSIGPSAMRCDGAGLTIEIDEMTVPIPSKLRGTLRITSNFWSGPSFHLDNSGAHRWQPLAPRARIEVSFERPQATWSGSAYVDRNSGDAPLEDVFSTWQWARAEFGDGAVVLYEPVRRDGTTECIALTFDASGRIDRFIPPPVQGLQRTGWRIDRAIRAECGFPARVIRTLEDAPFYARSLVETSLMGQRVTAMHESLSLDRFRRPIVRAMLPFKMPRRWSTSP